MRPIPCIIEHERYRASLPRQQQTKGWLAKHLSPAGAARKRQYKRALQRKLRAMGRQTHVPLTLE